MIGMIEMMAATTIAGGEGPRGSQRQEWAELRRAAARNRERWWRSAHGPQKYYAAITVLVEFICPVGDEPGLYLPWAIASVGTTCVLLL
jgi:hypothetical protein